MESPGWRQGLRRLSGGQRIFRGMRDPDDFRSDDFSIVSTSDVVQSVELRMEFQVAMGGELAPEFDTRLREANRAYFQAGFADGSVVVFVAKAGDEIAGCAMLQEQSMIPNRRVPNGRTGMVLNLHVRDGFRRRGIAQALMREVESEARRRKLDRLDLKATEMGEPLYRKLGWGDATGGRPMERFLV